MTTVLLVEDSLTDTEILVRSLRLAGLAVVSVTSCEEAWSAVQLQKPDLVLLDVMLPGQSGFEFCREFKESASTGQIPVVLCSTKGTQVDKLWGTLLGADAYLAKPVDPQELMRIVLQLIS